MKKTVFLLSCLLSIHLTFSPSLWADQEEEGSAPVRAVRKMASGVKQVAYEGPKDLAKETVAEGPKKRSLTGMIEGANEGTKKLLDHTLKGAYRVATLGQSELESYEVEEPRKGSDETTKIKISIPGT